MRAPREEWSTIPSDSSHRPSLAVCRCHGTVVVTLGGRIDATAAELLELVLDDLVVGQGNLAVEVSPEPGCVLEQEAHRVLAAVADRAQRHGAAFDVVSPEVVSARS